MILCLGCVRERIEVKNFWLTNFWMESVRDFVHISLNLRVLIEIQENGVEF